VGWKKEKAGRIGKRGLLPEESKKKIPKAENNGMNTVNTREAYK
jgi:hypothetical protein